jgi:hypothetical protein
MLHQQKDIQTGERSSKYFHVKEIREKFKLPGTPNTKIILLTDITVRKTSIILSKKFLSCKA